MKTHTFFLRLVRFRLRHYLVGQACINLYYVSLAFSGLIVRNFFDHLSGDGINLTLLGIVGLQAANTLLAMLGLGTANFFGFYLYSHPTRALLIRNLFHTILQRPRTRPAPDQEAISAGMAVNILRDDVEQPLFWTIWFGDLIGLVVTALFALWVMLQVSVWITLGTFAPLMAIVWLANRLSERIESYRQVSREATGQVAGAIGEIFGAVQAIQVNHAEERVIAHLRRLNEQRRRAMVKDQLLTRLIDALADNTVTLGTGMVLLLAAQSMRAGRFSVGDFALFVAYIWPVTELLRTTGALIAGYKQAGVSVARMHKLMPDARLETLVAYHPVHLTGDLPALAYIHKTAEHHLDLLEIRELRYQHRDRAGEAIGTEAPIPGIREIDLRLPRGSFTVITGRIGAGKTTLLRLILGLLPKDGGEILWNGEPVAAPAQFMTPPRVAYLPQTPRLFSETLRDTILMGIPPDAMALDDALYRAVLGEDLAQMEHGVDTLVGSRGVRLSGGQAQRVAAARMFVRRPELLVFDDLSRGLDVETENALWERLFAQEEVTCLAVSHRRAALERADQVVVLQAGGLLDVGTLDELLARCEEMQHLYEIEQTG